MSRVTNPPDADVELTATRDSLKYQRMQWQENDESKSIFQIVARSHRDNGER